MADAMNKLVNQAQAGQLTLLLGLDLDAALTDLPAGQTLAQGLSPGASSLASAAEGLPLWQVAAYLEQQVGGARAPGPLHRAVAALPLRRFLTAAYDDGLARALAGGGQPANDLLSDGDLASPPFLLERPALVRLCGRATGRQRLVVTRQAFQGMPDAARGQLWARVQGWLATDTVLLVGCDPSAGSDFERFVFGRLLRGFPAGAVLLWPGATQADQDRWAARGVTVLPQAPLPFLETLAQRLADAAPPPDPEAAALRALADVLQGQPSPQQLQAHVQAMPDPLAWVRLTLRLRLDANEQLRAALRLTLPRDTEGFDGDFRETGIALHQLQGWTAAIEEERWSGGDRFEGTAVEQQGQSFYDALLPPSSTERTFYGHALYLAQQTGAALQLVIQPEDEAGRLSPVPWELLHDGSLAHLGGQLRGSGFLAREYALYRHVAAVVAGERLAPRIERALLVAADPTFTLDQLNDELDAISAVLAQAAIPHDVRRPDHPDVSDPERIKSLLRNGGYDLFHFAGHGLFDASDPSQSRLTLGQPGEAGKTLSAEELAQVARDARLRLVFLSGCEVGLTPQAVATRPWEVAGMVEGLVRRGVPVTVGMRWLIGDQNAQRLASRFYEELVQHSAPSEQALLRARQALLQGTDWANAILTKRHGAL